jgi:hypothetical protein
MRFILNHGNSTLENGVYTFTLDKRLSNASIAQLRKASFELTTSGVEPLVVYLRSNALHDMCAQKQTLELTANQHENSSNIIGILEETHSKGRYRLRGIERVIPLKYTHLRNLDFYFTDHAGTNIIQAAASTTYDEVDDNFDTPTDQEKTGRIFRSFDTGGTGGNYGVNESLNRIYIATGGTNWKFTFLTFSSESGFDKLTIVDVDGGGSETTLVDEHSGTSLPDPITYTSTYPKIKFKWTSDSSNHDVGFDILLWEDNGDDNTLNGPTVGAYSVTVEGEPNTATWFAELDIDTK